MAKANEVKYADYMADTQRDDESVASADLIAAYEQGIDDLRAAVAGMTAEQVLCRPIPGRWSTLEVVAHLADTEIYYTDRIERTIALERPLLIGVDERPYPERLNYQAFDLAEQLDLFTTLHDTAHASFGHSRPKRGSVSPFTVKPASSRCGNWSSKLCGMCATTCRSSPRSGRRCDHDVPDP